MKKLLAISIALILSACSSLDFSETGPRLAVQYATAKFIERADNPQKRAEKVAEEVARAKVFFDVQGLPLPEIKKAVFDRLVERGLSPADTLLATQLINLIEDEINKGIQAGAISTEQRETVNAILNLIDDVTELYL